MKRILIPLSLALLLAAALLLWLAPAPAQAVPTGYQLNSEGDELIAIDPNQVEVKPPAPLNLSQTETNQPVFQSLHALTSAAEIQLHLDLDLARQAGPQAVLDFVARQPDPSPPLLQAAVLDAQIELAPAPQSGITAPNVPHASLNSGPCVYETIQAAVNAASTGDIVRVASGTFIELINVTAKQITIVGGYDAACTTLVDGGRTTVQALPASGSVIDVGSASVLTLRRLDLTSGSMTGAGVDVLGSSLVTLDNTDIHHNNAGSASGGGLYVGGGSIVTMTNDADIYNNTTTGTGGGAIVYGTLRGFSSLSDIYSNSALNGGGIAVLGGTVFLDDADVVANIATNLGGGIYASSTAEVTLTNSVFVGETAPCCQSAVTGGGIYAYNSQVNLSNDTTVMNNTATANGGGIYLDGGSTLVATDARVGFDNQAVSGNDAVLGAGIYIITSTLDYQGSIMNNIASNSGGGVYADNAVISMADTTIGGTGVYQPNQIGASGLNGGGMYLTNNTTVELDSTHIVANTLTNLGSGYGGGIYLRAGSLLTMTNSSIESHFLPSAFDGRGAAMYIYDATVTLDNTDVLTNTTSNLGGGARVFGTSTLNIQNGSSFVNNEALAGYGGAIAATDTPDINVSNSTFQYNSASTNGGAVYLDAGTLDFSGWWDVRWNGAGANGGAVAVTGTGDADFAVSSGLQQSFLAVNHAGTHGGAVYLANTDPVALYATSGYRLNLNTNSAVGSGGALYANAGGFFDIYGNIQATSNNAGSAGGFAYLSGGSRIWLDDHFATRPQVLVNNAPAGGGIYAVDSPRVELDGADFGFSNNGNRATAGSGGAVFLNNSTFSADNCTFRYSQATANGGAIAAVNSSLTIRASISPVTSASRPAQADRDLLSPTSITAISSINATFCDPLVRECSSFYNNTADSDGNMSGFGGAIHLQDSLLVMDQTYLHHNTAARGGALYAIGAGSVVEVNNTLLHHNSSTSFYGSAIRVDDNASVTLRHATLADNTGGPAFSQTDNFSVAWIYYSIIYRNDQGFSQEPDGAVCNIDQDGLAGLNLAPLFLAPGSSNYRLTIDSPAVDACTNGLDVDLDGNFRPAWEKFDMGAYELPELHLYLPFARKGP